MQSDPDVVLDVLYRLRQNWARRSEADAQTVLKAIESLIAEYEARRDARADG